MAHYENLEIAAEWRIQNAQSRYPFNDYCPMTGSGGTEVPNNLFLDASIAFASSSNTVRLTDIAKTNAGITFTLKNDIDNEIGYIQYSQTLDTSLLLITSEDGRKLGAVVVDIAEALSFLAKFSGVSAFSATAATFCARCLHAYSATVVTSLGLQAGTALSGNVVLIGENGVVLQHVTQEVLAVTNFFAFVSSGAYAVDQIPTTVNQIRIHVVGEPLAAAVTQNCNNGQSAVFAETVNGVSPNSAGNISIVADRRLGPTALRIVANAAQSELIFELAGVAP